LKTKKLNSFSDTFARMYFWRTQQQQEIDFVEEKDGNISVFEFKWKDKKTKFPQKFLDTYNADGCVKRYIQNEQTRQTNKHTHTTSIQTTDNGP
jgi:hypothetical protein